MLQKIVDSDKGGNIEIILKWFKMLTSLKINYCKCGLLFGWTTVMLLLWQMHFGCKVEKLPTKYLGLPLCLGVQKKSLWDSVVEWILDR